MTFFKFLIVCFYCSIAHVEGKCKDAKGAPLLKPIGIPSKLEGKFDVTYTYDIKFEVSYFMIS